MIEKLLKNSHVRYARYLLRHKWYVGKQCFKDGLYVRGIVHDWHKFLPTVWMAYVKHFYMNCVGNEKLEEIDREFDLAWLHHQNTSDHHWEYWVSREDTPCSLHSIRAIEMSEAARKELLADWYGAGKAMEKPGDWFEILSYWNYLRLRATIHPVTANEIDADIRWNLITEKHERGMSEISVQLFSALKQLAKRVIEKGKRALCH
jgi:hypothetical protein